MSSGNTTKREAPTELQEPRVSLVFYHRDGAKIVVPTSEPLVVGRAWPADIVVDDPSVSRNHARFFVAPDGGVAFEDLGSTNGTRLNGALVARGRITAVDEVRVGDVVVGVHVLSKAGAGASGLLGYDALVRIFEDEIVRARTFGRPATLLMVGARSPGHPLRTWAPSLLERLRPVDRAAVYAADAVLVVLPEAGRAEAEALGAALVANDASLRFGAASFPEDETSVDALLESARTRMIHGASPSSSRSAGPASERVVGERMRAVWEMVDRVAASNLPILVLGETGAGKEVVSRALHERSGRRDGPLRSVNCATIPGNLVESVLFGHEKGAFTGADRTTKGLFEQAHGGTLMLDEIGELPPGAQAALLRVLETKQLVRVGGDREVTVDVRVVAATHRDLERMCEAGSFRSDLYYRLQGVTLVVPPLRERPDEVRPLAESFLRHACRENGRSVRGFDEPSMAALLRWGFPGNVRELKNVVERAVVVARGEVVTLVDLPERLRTSASGGAGAGPVGAGNVGAAGSVAPGGLPVAAPFPPIPPAGGLPGGGLAGGFSGGGPAGGGAELDPALDYKERLRIEMQRYETQLIVDALARANGNVTAAAQALKIPVRTLTHKMQQLGIKKKFDAE